MLWRDPRWAGLLMTGYVLLSLAVGPDGFVRIDSRPVGPSAILSGTLAAAFFAWRVTRGGRFSRILLIVVTGLAFGVTALAIAPRFGPAVLGALAALTVQLALLLSPAVYRRTRPRDHAGPTTWPRVRPPLAVLLFGLFAGLAITLIGLSHIGSLTAGCAAPFDHCVAPDDGHPLPWLAASHSALIVSWTALFKDLTQYTVISAAVLYGWWLGPRTSPPAVAGRFPLAAIAGGLFGGLTLSAATVGIPWAWVRASQDVPLYNPSALAADTAVWSLAGLGGYLAVRALLPSSGRQQRPTAAITPVTPADDGA